ncbi:hypothetical protein FOJ82_13130 [Tessaracoccus rhinocerotis]|uniref:Uncharacterized protein n=1 Tax=Tessaracoccus rhinocerotis TaxID=1689449 RepID=A0A553JYD3_9ACTN|nr:hypothetical protein [Tessaracoccus rhinocerotis]TRY17465.1 hypothetical protein FOJ82_13130 [Tessaracoccus rhinocerotis]
MNEFFRLSNELAQNPDLSLQPLADITVGSTQDTYLGELIEYREMNAVQVGKVDWSILTVGEVLESEGQKTVEVRVCSDSTQSDVIDQDTGQSILSPDRVPVISWAINAVSPAGSWIVGDLTNFVDGCRV